MKGYEIKFSTSLTGRVIGAIETMIDEIAGEISSMTGNIGSTHTGRWQRPKNTIDGMIV
jgi:hypothetical protein